MPFRDLKNKLKEIFFSADTFTNSVVNMQTGFFLANSPAIFLSKLCISKQTYIQLNRFFSKTLLKEGNELIGLVS